jgi:molecular chaperone DnaK
VLQGERAEAKYNRTLGRFHLEGIPPAPRGTPKIKVTFDIDANGILSVTAKDEATGKDQKITIQAQSGLSEDEVENMVKDAQQHEEEDRKKRERVELRNKADQLCYSVEKSLGELKGKVSEDKVSNVETKVKSLREAIDNEDYDSMQSRMEEVENAMKEISTEAYGQAGAEAGGGNGAAGAQAGGGSEQQQKKGGQDDVIDAEFEEGNR